MSRSLDEAYMRAKAAMAKSVARISRGTTSSPLSIPEKGSPDGIDSSLDFSSQRAATKASVTNATLPKQAEKLQSAPYIEKASKMRPSLLPVEAQIAAIKAFEYGAGKYGTEQWRYADITKTDIINALGRHFLAYQEGETLASDSQVEHLGHIIANCAILLARFDKEQK